MVVGQGGAAFFYFLSLLSRLPDVRCCFPVGVGCAKARLLRTRERLKIGNSD